MIGFGALLLALAATLLAVFFETGAYLADKTKKSPKSPKSSVSSLGERGKSCFIWHYLAAAFIGVSAVYLLFIILSDKFEYAYVFSYSSRDLALFYKLSAFWAGQEGSFLLWIVFHAIFGLILVGRKNAPPGVMVVYGLLQAVLLVMLLAKNPFMMLVEQVADGNGLNPLLQDPWMVIHPPIVFLGYAGFAVPFAYALDGLLTGKHERWVSSAIPWTLFSWAALGAGIFIGGFWAYKVLGWGGYWAWDPVENSSLVPWLAAGALCHLLVLARIRPAGLKPAYLAGIFTFALVLYGTYLTRSGILSDFSTHSFADEGIGSLLAGCVFIIVIASLALFIARFSTLPSGSLYPKIKSREFVLAAAALVFGILGALVFIGMSTPLLTLLLGRAQNVGVNFYNSTSLPLAAVLAFLLTVAPALKWGTGTGDYKKLIPAIPFALIGVGLALAYGIYNVFILLVAGFSLAGLFTNLFFAWKRSIGWATGLSHAGAALMLMGIMFSSGATQSEIVNFSKGEAKIVFGEKITYQGLENISDGSGFYQTFLLGEGGEKTVRSLTKLNKEGKSAVREPGIVRKLAEDLYIAPLMKTRNDGAHEFMLRKGEKMLVGDSEGLEIVFNHLSMQSPPNDNSQVLIRADFEVLLNEQKQNVLPELIFHKGHFDEKPITVFEKFEITLTGVNPTEGAVMGFVRNLSPTTKIERLDAEISRKPLINLVWLGAFLIVIGTFWAGFKLGRV